MGFRRSDAVPNFISRSPCSVIRAAELTRRLIGDARQSEACQLLMSIPGVGVVTATAFATAVGRSSQLPNVTIRWCLAGPHHTSIPIRSGGLQRAYLHGDHQVRNLLYEAACVIVTRSSAESKEPPAIRAVRSLGIKNPTVDRRQMLSRSPEH